MTRKNKKEIEKRINKITKEIEEKIPKVKTHTFSKKISRRDGIYGFEALIEKASDITKVKNFEEFKKEIEEVKPIYRRYFFLNIIKNIFRLAGIALAIPTKRDKRIIFEEIENLSRLSNYFLRIEKENNFSCIQEENKKLFNKAKRVCQKVKKANPAI